MKTTPWIIIIVLLGALFLQRECTHEVVCPECPQTTSDTIHDTITKPTVQYIPKPVYTDTGSTKWRFHQVDTLQILSEYFSRHLYQDTLQNDSNALIVLTDTVSQNRILYRYPQITLYPQIIRQSTRVEVPLPSKNKFYLGMAIGRNPNQFSLAPSMLLQSKKGSGYSISYDLVTHDIYLGIYWHISFKR
ncbi:MAG: hypothetical protein WC341_14365 [Bacteroidales bacterium]|jgi:hypothetical protein